jgi:predicted  nucleic acid-binding Zn-ribbon protein
LNAGKFALDETNYEISSPKKNLPIKEELEEYKKKLEAIKSSIQDYQTQNDKLNHQLNNLTTNTSIYDIKSNGIIY